MFVVYKIVNSINDKVYVGSTIELNKRWSRHKWDAKNNKQSPIYIAMNEYGVENFHIEVLAQVKDEDDLYPLEQKYIEKYDSILNGYNISNVRDMHRSSVRAKLKESWSNPEEKEARVNKMIESSEYRAHPIIGVSRFDASIKEYPSINAYMKDGLSWGSLRPCLAGESKHAYNHCWFYKEEGKTNEEYITLAKERLGHLFSSLNTLPILAESVDGLIKYHFNNLKDVESKGFTQKEVRQVLNGRRKSHKGFKFTTVN